MATPNPNEPKKPALDIYGALMLGASLFLLIGTIFMWIELGRYGGVLSYPWKTPTSGSAAAGS